MYSALISVSSAGDHLIVPAIPGKRIRVLNYVLTSDRDAAVSFNSGFNSLTGTLYIRGYSICAFAGQLFPAGALMLFQTNIGESLNLASALESNVSGHLVYILSD